MSDNGKHFYESMFILDARSAKKDYDGLQTELVQILNKHGVEVAQTHQWGERRLAYEIRRQKKGYYVLMHLEADPSSIADLKKDLTLFEPLLRQFYLRIDAIPEKFEFPAEPEDRRDGRRIGRRDGPPRGDYQKRPVEKSREPAEAAPPAAAGEEKPRTGEPTGEPTVEPTGDPTVEVKKEETGAESPEAGETVETKETETKETETQQVETQEVETKETEAVAPEDGAGSEKVPDAPSPASEAPAPEAPVSTGDTTGSNGDSALEDPVRDENQG